MFQGDANKHYRILKGQSLMDNPETLATLGTQDTGQGQTQQKHNKSYIF
jgi:hypothetical protein